MLQHTRSAAADDLLNLALQPLAHVIWASKYRLRAADGQVLDATPDATLERIAAALQRHHERVQTVSRSETE